MLSIIESIAASECCLSGHNCAVMSIECGNVSIECGRLRGRFVEGWKVLVLVVVSVSVAWEDVKTSYDNSLHSIIISSRAFKSLIISDNSIYNSTLPNSMKYLNFRHKITNTYSTISTR